MMNFERKNNNIDRYNELPKNNQTKREELLAKKASMVEKMKKTLWKMGLKSRRRIGIKVEGSSPVSETPNNYGDSKDYKNFEGRKADKIKEPLEKMLNYIYDKNVENSKKSEDQADNYNSKKEPEIGPVEEKDGEKRIELLKYRKKMSPIRLEAVRQRRNELASIIKESPSNKAATEEDDELEKEEMSLEKALEEVRTELLETKHKEE